MNLFALNLLLALGWSVITKDVSLGGLVTGFAVGYAALWITSPLYDPTTYFRRGRSVVGLIVFFAKELVVSSLRVAWDVLTPRERSHPGIIAMPLDAKSDLEILLVANLISLTPGTLSLDVSSDRSVLYVHVMFLGDPEQERRALKRGMERRVLEVLR